MIARNSLYGNIQTGTGAENTHTKALVEIMRLHFFFYENVKHHVINSFINNLSRTVCFVPIFS